MLQGSQLLTGLTNVCLNPFEVREVLQVILDDDQTERLVSIPLKSGRCCKRGWQCHCWVLDGLNPFEVREVLQATGTSTYGIRRSLNPFEVREVLQGQCFTLQPCYVVSIPLKSGRCCKISPVGMVINWCLNPFEVREVLQGV